MIADAARATDALYSIPPDLPRDEWVKAGMAFHAAGGDSDTFDQWSAPGATYNAADCRSTWRSFKAAPGGVGAGALFGMARDHGWQDGNATRQAPAKPATKPAELPKAPRPGMAAADVWERCEAATNRHGYITRKQIAADALPLLRIVPANDPLTHYRDWLAVPGYSPDGTLQTIEFISGDGQKMTLKGSHKSGASLTVGPATGAAVVVEGLGAASAAYMATGLRSIGCFGAGNIKRVVEALRQREPETHITIAPDRGKELDARKIATEFNCAVACLSEAEPSNFDINDLGLRDGFDAVEFLLSQATEPPKPKIHPLARYVEIDGSPKPPRWVIPGFVGHGVTVIAGAHGVGKTTALLPLAMTAAGLHGDDLIPRQWRHIIYVTEDVEQARRIVAGITTHSHLGISLDLVRERLHIVEAVRLDPAYVATVGTTYREQFTRDVAGVPVLPLVVLDTKSAVLSSDNENDNAEASRMMAALKQGFDGLPVWLVGHVSKANLTRSDALTSRGASAIEGDANQTMFLIREGDGRYLVQGKTRFEPRWPELEITSHTAPISALDEFGNTETVLLRWGIAAPAQTTRKEAAEQAAEQQRLKDEASLRTDIRDAVEVAWLAGNPLNRAGVKAKMRRKTSDVVALLENLLNERWLYEVTVPAAVRLVNSKAAFLVSLTPAEHDAALSGGGPPADKLAIPASWQKQAVSPVPAPKGESVEVDHA